MPTWSQLRETLAAPWQLARLCCKGDTWRTFAEGAEMLALQCHGGLTVTTPVDDGATDDEAPVALRSLIQLDGDVLLMISPSWLEQQDAQEPDRLRQALADHRAQISAALLPLRQGFDIASHMMVLASRSRWSILAAAGLSQTGAIALAPDLSIGSLFAWFGDPAGHLGMLLWQSLSVTLFAAVGLVRWGLRWWIRRGVNNRLPGLLERLSGDQLSAARAAA